MFETNNKFVDLNINGRATTEMSRSNAALAQ